MRPESLLARLRPLVFASIPVVVSFLVLTAGRPAPDRGKEIFDTVCSACHTLTPPPLKAPPLLMVAGHYMQESGSEDAAQEAMMRWIPAPDTALSLLPDHAVTRFGQMAPLPLPKDDIEAVVKYVFTEWNAADKPGPDGPACEGERCGQGMQMRHGMQMRLDSLPGQGMQMRHGESRCADCAKEKTGCAGGMCRTQQQPGQGMQMRHGMNMRQDSLPGQGMQMRHGMNMRQGEGSMSPGHQCPHMQQSEEGQ